ncbi:MAG: glycogen synthase [Pseudomonadota bacterium]|jgi:starch synthase
MPYRILFITAEYAPLAKTGGLGDVSAALCQYLHAQGHDVRVFLPWYRDLNRAALTAPPVVLLEGLVLELGTYRYEYRVLVGTPSLSQQAVHFIDCPALFDRAGLYGHADEHRSFLLLTRAAFEVAQRMAFAPHILHCNDWHTAFAPLYLRTLYAWDRLFAATRSVLTIHNIGYQGAFWSDGVADLSLGDAQWMLHQDELRDGRINPMVHGILYADLINTVSPTYAQEIRTPEYGAGLDPYLRERGAAVCGILNGVDYQEWDPQHDRHLDQSYSAKDLSGKTRLKQQLASELSLSLGRGTLLFGIVSRLVSQKGIELLEAVLPEVLSQSDCGLVALGSGDARYEKFFTQLAADYPQRVHFTRGYSERLAHWIEAAADAFLMPSQYEPCGLNQMYSLRYGTVPLVRRTGGLADSVTPYNPATGQGDGLLFERYTPSALRAVIDEALALYGTPHWGRMIQNGMARDYAWETQGRLYVDAYRALVGPA